MPQVVALFYVMTQLLIIPSGYPELLEELKDRIRSAQVRAALEYGWSQSVLVHMISGRLHERKGKALTNFKRTLPASDSEMAGQILHDPYNFDFLTLRNAFHERELERGLLIHLRDLLLELGCGFAYVRSVAEADRRLDLPGDA